MMRHTLLAVTVALSLCACSGGQYVGPAGTQKSATPAPGVSATPGPTVAPGQTATPAPAASATPAPGQSSPATPAATPSIAPSPSPLPTQSPFPKPAVGTTALPFLYVSNNASQDYLLFAEGATGDTAPMTTITGVCASCSGVASSPDGTQFYYVEADDKTIYIPQMSATFTSPVIQTIGVFTVDAAGKFYIADPTTGSIYIFAANPSGTVMPIATINGSNTGLGNITGIAVDLYGTIYATTYQGSAVFEFPAGSNGNVTPKQISGALTQLNQTFGVAVDLNGQIAVSTQGGGLVIFAPGTTGNTAPSKQFVTNLSDNDSGVCYDPATDDIFVVKNDGSVAAFDQSGNQPTYLTGSSTALNHPKNCAVSNYDIANNTMMSRTRH